jgi:hypothetical protein
VAEHVSIGAGKRPHAASHSHAPQSCTECDAYTTAITHGNQRRPTADSSATSIDHRQAQSIPRRRLHTIITATSHNNDRLLPPHPFPVVLLYKRLPPNIQFLYNHNNLSLPLPLLQPHNLILHNTSPLRFGSPSLPNHELHLLSSTPAVIQTHNS